MAKAWHRLGIIIHETLASYFVNLLLVLPLQIVTIVWRYIFVAVFIVAKANLRLFLVLESQLSGALFLFGLWQTDRLDSLVFHLLHSSLDVDDSKLVVPFHKSSLDSFDLVLFGIQLLDNDFETLKGIKLGRSGDELVRNTRSCDLNRMDLGNCQAHSVVV